jgi:chromosome segregation ATPase
MSSRIAQRRRHRDSDSEDAEGEDDSGRPGSSGSGSGSSKRRRTGVFGGESSEDDSSNIRDARSQRRNGATTNASGFQPGAIVRVNVTNFVTYEDAVFHPGPNLNMVIGPNGTGKSSLVCAICLGLGFSAIHLGRATKFGEFVKYGKDHATIEIELERQPEDNKNYIVKVRITRDGDKRKWWINGDETNLKTVSNLMKKLGIQVDNLCQFLPQDRVAEFAALSPIELLHETQRAAAPPEMLAWHDELKTLRKEQKALQINHDSNEEILRTMEERQENLRSDVERLQERAAIQEKIKLMEKCVPFVEYREAGKKFNDAKGRKAAATRKLKDLETQVEPIMQAVNRKQEYHDQIHTVVEQLKKGVGEAERAAELAYTEIQEIETSIKGIGAKRNAEAETSRQQKNTRTSIQRIITNLEAQLRNPPPVFDGASWNAKIVSRSLPTSRRS